MSSLYPENLNDYLFTKQGLKPDLKLRCSDGHGYYNFVYHYIIIDSK